MRDDLAVAIGILVVILLTLAFLSWFGWERWEVVEQCGGRCP